MALVFDPAKDKANRSKHGISLARAEDMEIAVVIGDNRTDYGEGRYRAFRSIDGVAYCLAFTVRGADVRAISLRRAQQREMRRYARQEKNV